LDEAALEFVAPLVTLFGESWARCFYSRHWECRVAALTHLSAHAAQRLEHLAETDGTMQPQVLGELLDGSMRAVHEGLGDQNVRVYTEACLAVTSVVPAFCGAVDGRLLVAHLAPLLRQLCARMGDLKESVRTQTTQTLFRLLRPPTGNIVSPVAMAMLILRNLAPSKDGSSDGEKSGGSETPQPTANSKAAAAPIGWLCRLAALRDLTKEHTKSLVQQPGADHPGEWLRLAEGLRHSDPTVRHESARLFALICKAHLRSLGDVPQQEPGREAWVAALPKDVPAKSFSHVRRLLKLPEQVEGTGAASASGAQAAAPADSASIAAWEVPATLAAWAGCKPAIFDSLRSPKAGEEKEVLAALKALGKAAGNHEESARRGAGMGPEDAFAGICRAIQQALGSPVGADRNVFLASVELCQMAVAQLAPGLSGLDVNMGLAKTFPTLMERTSLNGAGDVKAGVASDKLVQQLARHPKVGCEAVTKMVISAVARTERPIRPLVLLGTLLSDYGLRLCAQRDIVSLLLSAVGAQLERLSGFGEGKAVADSGATDEYAEQLRPQLVGVLSTCSQFSPETVHFCMSEVEASHRRLIAGALQEAPNPKLVALGATAAEQTAAGHVAGSAVRAASRNRGASPSPAAEGGGRGACESSPLRRPAGPLPSVEAKGLQPSRSTGRLSSSASTGSLGQADASPHDSRSRRSRHSRGAEAAPVGQRGSAGSEESPHFSETSTAASTDCPPQGDSSTPPASPRQQQRRYSLPGESPGSTGGSRGMEAMQRSIRRGGSDASTRPPAPMGLSTALGGSGRLDQSWHYGADGEASGGGKRRSSDGRFSKGKENAASNDSMAGLMDVLSQLDAGRRSR